MVGWATAVTNLAAEWAAALLRDVPQLDEGAVLRLIYRFFGYDDLGLPASLQELGEGNLPLGEIFRREVGKLKGQASGRVPLYPPVSLAGGAPQVRQFCQAVVDCGCDGAMLGVGPSAAAIEAAGESGAGRILMRLLRTR